MPKTKKTEKKIEKPVWLKYTEKEVEDIILNIVKNQPELTSEKIGLILRDTYGIPKTKIYGIKISEVLKKAGQYQDPTLINLEKKTEKIESHLEKNKQDKRAMREKARVFSQLRKIKKYLKQI